MKRVMGKKLAAIFVLAGIAVSCSKGISHIQIRQLPAPNPTSYSFPLPLEQVYSKARQAFSMEHQVDDPIFGRSAVAANLEDTLAAECATNAVFGKAVFTDPTNVDDIYLHTFGMPFVISSVYCGQNGGLPFIAAFHLHLEATGSNTVVTITTSDTEVINGTKFGFGPCGPGRGYNFEHVRPTTVEEYTILRYLGRSLGITNMPEIIMPKP